MTNWGHDKIMTAVLSIMNCTKKYLNTIILIVVSTMFYRHRRTGTKFSVKVKYNNSRNVTDTY